MEHTPTKHRRHRSRRNPAGVWWSLAGVAVLVTALLVGYLVSTEEGNSTSDWVKAADMACAEYRRTTDKIMLPDRLDDNREAQRTADGMVAATQTLLDELTRDRERNATTNSVEAELVTRMNSWKTWVTKLDPVTQQRRLDPRAMYSTTSAAAANAGAETCGKPAGPEWVVTLSSNTTDENWLNTLLQSCGTYTKQSSVADQEAASTLDVTSYLDELHSAAVELQTSIDTTKLERRWSKLVVQRWENNVTELVRATAAKDLEGARNANAKWMTTAELLGGWECGRGAGVGEEQAAAYVGAIVLPATTGLHGVDNGIIAETERFATNDFAEHIIDPRYSGVDPTNNFAVASTFAALGVDFKAVTGAVAADPTTASVGTPEKVGTGPAGPGNPWMLTVAFKGGDGQCVAIDLKGWPRLTSYTTRKPDTKTCSADGT